MCSVPEMSLGERAWGRAVWWWYDAKSRPLTLVAVVVLLGVVAEMAARVTEASRFPIDGFEGWVLTAALGFGSEVQFALLVVSLILVIDRLTGNDSRGQSAVFGSVLVLAGASVVANVLATIEGLRLSLTAYGASVTESRIITIVGHVGPIVLASLSGGLALAGMRGLLHREGRGDE